MTGVFLKKTETLGLFLFNLRQLGFYPFDSSKKLKVIISRLVRSFIVVNLTRKKEPNGKQYKRILNFLSKTNPAIIEDCSRTEPFSENEFKQILFQTLCILSGKKPEQLAKEKTALFACGKKKKKRKKKTMAKVCFEGFPSDLRKDLIKAQPSLARRNTSSDFGVHHEHPQKVAIVSTERIEKTDKGLPHIYPLDSPVEKRKALIHL